jgi:heme-degrading monooxygenase HmoA
MLASSLFAKAFPPPYYAVIFSSRRTEGDQGYNEMAECMVRLASQMPGFLGVESVRGADGIGITVSYWESTEAIRTWKAHSEHEVAQRTGNKLWYSEYSVRIARVEREYGKRPDKHSQSSRDARPERAMLPSTWF